APGARGGGGGCGGEGSRDCWPRGPGEPRSTGRRPPSRAAVRTRRRRSLGSSHRLPSTAPFEPFPRRGGVIAQAWAAVARGGVGGGASAWRSGRAKRGPVMRLPAPLDRLQERLARAWHERAVALKAASFAMVGVVNTLVDYSVFLSAYYLIKLPLIPANVLAWLVAVSGSYVMNCFITFAAESGRQLRWRAYGAF